MKKYLYLSIVALMSAAMMFGCKGKNNPSSTDPVDPSTLDNKTVKCWEYTLTESDKSATLYFWGTEQGLVTFIEGEVAEAKRQGFVWTYTYKASKESDLDACMERNNEGADCWKVTITKGGSSKTEYLFTSYECAEIYAKAEAGKSGSYSIEKADAKDPDSCDALNGPSGGGGTTDDNDKHCWHATSSYVYSGKKYESENWFWATQKEMEQTKSAFLASMQDAQYEYEMTNDATEEACMENATGKFACYQINGPGYTMYFWTTDQILQNQYGSNPSITWQLADANDEDACNALNN